MPLAQSPRVFLSGQTSIRYVISEEAPDEKVRTDLFHGLGPGEL